MRFLILILITFLAGQNLLAQETLFIQNASRKYNLSVHVVEKNDREKIDSYVKGSARISFHSKDNKRPFQVLRLPNIIISKRNIAFNPKINDKPRSLYAETYSFVFEDFNFDGYEDLAIWNGTNGGYGGPSYNIYLYKSGRFYLNKKLSKLTEGVYLGLFFTQFKKKRLITFSKSGCCYHETEIYTLVQNNPLLVEKEIEYFIEGNKFQETRKLVKGRWIKRTKKLKNGL